MRLAGLVIAGAALVAMLLLAACAPDATTVRDARETLGTFVTVTAYGADEEAIESAVDEAFDAMAAVERVLDVYSADSAASEFNMGAGPEPTELALIESAAERLEVGMWFSVRLRDVVAAWDFESGGSIPEDSELVAAMAAGGFDPGGAAKGLALDAAIDVLRSDPAVTAALVSAGSTTLTFGSKPDGGLWRIGIEDPREPSEVIATIEAEGGITVSTSGDYQRYFERGGERFHHILDPTTGFPARGLRTLTVIGATDGLDSDILSTALFVAGKDAAESYARDSGLGLFLIDDSGRALGVPDPNQRFTITQD